MNQTLDQDQARAEGELLRTIESEGLSPASISLFQDLILSFYRSSGRDLPWRRTTDPYHILVSEIMLQQTQVDRVIPKYIEFLGAFPTINNLADAGPSRILPVWKGLGYNRRVLSLQKTAMTIRDEYSGTVPPDPGILATFPGIGDATAAAICAYAFNMPVVYIETNIRRIMLHYFFRHTDGVRDRDIIPYIAATLNTENPRDWYNALMDYGSHLKLRLADPNRRSAHYSRQSRFAGSNREIRGKILSHLMNRGGITTDALASSIGSDIRRVQKVCKDLCQEGFIREEAGSYSIEK